VQRIDTNLNWRHDQTTQSWNRTEEEKSPEASEMIRQAVKTIESNI